MACSRESVKKYVYFSRKIERRYPDPVARKRYPGVGLPRDPNTEERLPSGGAVAGWRIPARVRAGADHRL